MVILRQSLREQVRDEILDRIASGKLIPGTKVILSQLAEETGVSYVTVREAVYELIGLGIMESSHHKGAKVCGINLRETIDSFEVRAALEQFAAGKAAVSLKGNCEDLRALIKTMDQSIQQGDLREFQKQNHAFHRAIVEASGNPFLLKSWETLAIGIRTRWFMDAYKDSGVFTESNNDHHPIVNALNQGDGEKAASLTFEHSMLIIELMKKELQSSSAENVYAM